MASGLAEKALVQISYAIGVAIPTSISVSTQGTGIISDEKLSNGVKNTFDLRPRGIVEMLDLLRPIYTRTAAYGHFGRDPSEFSWEATNKVEELKKSCGID